LSVLMLAFLAGTIRAPYLRSRQSLIAGYMQLPGRGAVIIVMESKLKTAEGKQVNSVHSSESTNKLPDQINAT
ncbi:MAG: hypothetical protein WA213_02335, partial [Terriglobales bacterium]